MRQSRKIDHINYALAEPDVTSAGFSDVNLVHRSVPELNWVDIDTSVDFLAKKLTAPIIINAMTGGHPDVRGINGCLAAAAKEAGVAIALGSQRAALEDDSVIGTFKVVREVYPKGVLIANLSAHCTVDEARRVVEMIEADALQLHVNIPQELAMAEGDRNFSGMLSSISRVVEHLEVPVIVKEVGFGMSMETALQLHRAGVKMIDISGRGGTNFISIEEGRSDNTNTAIEGISHWGISTVTSLAEVKHLNLPLYTVASGGVRTSYDMAKAIALGANLTGISRPFLQTLLDHGQQGLDQLLDKLITGLKKIMLMCGAKNIEQLQKVPVVITGETAQWLKCRGVNLDTFAQKHGEDSFHRMY